MIGTESGPDDRVQRASFALVFPARGFSEQRSEGFVALVQYMHRKRTRGLGNDARSVHT